MRSFLLVAYISLLAAISSAQTMTFDSGASEPGFTFGGWVYDGGLDLLYPTAPNANWTGWISRPDGCWNALSFNPQCFAAACGFPSGTTWRAYSDQGDEVFFQIPSNNTTYIELNFYGINTLYFQIETLGDGSPNQTWNFDNLIYLIPDYTPAEEPTMLVPLTGTLCPGSMVSMTPIGFLNSATEWYVYEGECGVGEGQVVFGAYEVNVDETTTFYFRGEDSSGCTEPGPCAEVVITIVEPDGCTDPDACNYDPAATCDDGSCILPQWYIPLELEGGPVIQACELPAGYSLADQTCIEQIIADDPFCVNETFDLLCSQSYYCCVGAFSCNLPTACNYDNTRCPDQTLCVFPGCTNALACNYDAAAGCDDGSCILPDGCTDATACNYDATALCDDGSCIYPQWYIPEVVGAGPMVSSCEHPVGHILANQLCAAEVVLSDPFCINVVWDDVCSAAYNCCLGNYACHDPAACVYDINLCEDSWLCTYPGCNDPEACNYDATAGCDDGSCEYPVWMIPTVHNGGPAIYACELLDGYIVADPECIVPIVSTDAFCSEDNWDVVCEQQYQCCLGNCGCTFPDACNYDPTALYTDGSCTFPGCTNISACNYDPFRGCDDGSCEYLSCRGCTGQMACNYDPLASIDDGSCDYASCAGCTYMESTNYDASAVLDDGSCIFPTNITCLYDLDNDDMISTGDLLMMIGAFGTTCP